MDGMNMQASFNNLTQMDRVTQDQHQLPIVNQAQNAELEKNRNASKIDKPNETEKLDGKIIDPKKKREEERKKRKKEKEEENRKRGRKNRGDRSGHIIDFSV